LWLIHGKSVVFARLVKYPHAGNLTTYQYVVCRTDGNVRCTTL